jgi:hypothetical protein
MARIGIIISNHGAEEWTEKALKELYKVEEVLYFKHPDIDPRANKPTVWGQAYKFLKSNGIMDIEGLIVASINGEYGFSTACVHILTPLTECVYPTSERGATEKPGPDGSIKTIHVYKFVQFRRW